MELSQFIWYLIIINIIGFILFLVNALLHTYTAERQINIVLTLVSLFGGSLGIVLSMLIFGRKAEKENMMFRVFVACMLVIQIVLFLIIKGYVASDISLAFGKFFRDHKILVVYLIAINFVTMIAFAIDKIAAIKHKSRIRIVTLLGLAFIGGSVGGLIAMYLFRHKIRMNYFTVGLPLMMVMQIIVLFYSMNAAW